MTEILATVELSKPLKTHDGEISSVKLSMPTAAAYIHYDDPFKFNIVEIGDGKSRFDFTYSNRSMLKFISLMTVPRIDDLILEGLDAVDYLRVRARATDILMDLGRDPSVPSAA